MRLTNSYIVCVLITAFLLAGCSSTRHVPDGKYLLDNSSIEIHDDASVTASSLHNYLRQTPNHRVLGFAKLQLGVYNLSGRDSTKWYNKWVRKIGQEPVIYDDQLTEQSARQLRLALINRGYNDVTVSIDTTRRDSKKKIDVKYVIHTGQPHVIRSIDYNIEDAALEKILAADTANYSIRPGVLFDRNNLDAERTRITTLMRNNGYYAFNKDYITFIADTAAGSKEVDLVMNLRCQSSGKDDDAATVVSHKRYLIRNVCFITDYNMLETAHENNRQERDTVRYKGITVIYGKDHYLTPRILDEKCYIQPGRPYSGNAVERTYEALSQLGILKYVNITMEPAGKLGDEELLDAYILISRTKKQGITFELEGTNSEGDFGFGVGMTYQHRNLAHSSELLTAKFRGSYESLSGNLDGLINNRYTEFGAEVGITFPKFEAPFVSKSFKQKIRATTEFALSFNHQERPEYTRIIAGAAWKYKWANRLNTVRRTFDFIDINFVYLPNSTIDFINTIAPTNPLLRYSYEDHFIMRMGYTYYKTNRLPVTTGLQRYRPQTDIYTFRASAETAGNLLYAISSAIGQKKSDGAYKIFNIQYAQYVKGDIAYSWNHTLDSRNSVALHGQFGIAYPYGNSSMVPFEKRFYAGGANGVRGWSVRTLGPGCYDSRNSVTDFINQCGDISLFLSAEYRARLFWVLEGALFIDAGNIWTIRDYETQAGGVFKFDEFYKQIALAYGLGIRFDFTYFLLRLDLGMKAHNPAQNQEKWPLIHPRWHRDAAFHFSVGYPF